MSELVFKWVSIFLDFQHAKPRGYVSVTVNMWVTQFAR